MARVVDDLPVAVVGVDPDDIVGGTAVPPLRPVECATVEDAIDLVDARAVTCVAIAAGSVDGDALDRLQAADSVISVVVLEAADQERWLRTGASDAVPPGVDPAVVRRRVRSAATAGHRLNWYRRDSRALESILQTAPAYVDVKDTDTKHVRINHPERNAWMLGMDTRERWEREDDVDTDVGERSYRQDRRVLDQETVFSDVPETERTDEGSVIGFRWSKWPWYREDGEIGGLVRHVVDVTDLRRREEDLVRRNARLEEYASTVAHDLRNPLNIATGNLELAQLDHGDDEHLDAVAEALERVQEIVTDALEAARRERDRSREPVRLATVVDEAWETVATGRAVLTVDVPAGTTVNAERGRLRQVFENLLRNAVEHGSSDGRPAADDPEAAGSPVSVRVGVFEEADSGVGFFVEDDGPGFSDAVVDPDEVAHPEVGYGLDIVELIASDPVWEVSYGSGTDGGARVEIAAPLVTSEPAEPASTTVVALDETVTLGSSSVEGDGELSGDTASLTAGGFNFWGDHAEGHLTVGEAVGNCRVTARVTGLDGPNQWSKGGVVLVDDPRAPSLVAGVALTRDNGAEVLWRGPDDDGIESRPLGDHAVPPTWLRMTRHGDAVTASTRHEGGEWRHVAQWPDPFAESVALGLLACAVNHAGGEGVVEVAFDEVSAVEAGDGG